MTLKMEFGAMVCNRRRRLGLTQEKLAEKVDASVRHIHNIESGECNLGLSLAVRLAVCLEIDLNELKKYAICDMEENSWADSTIV